jgi:Protein of unknown function (DUF2865)
VGATKIQREIATFRSGDAFKAKRRPRPDEGCEQGERLAVKFSNNLRPICLALIAAALTTVLPPAPASAQGIFESLFGTPKRAGASTAYADPNAHFNPFGGPTDPSAAPAVPRPSASVSYCVRLCDGRYFPIQKSSGAEPVETCSNFCPAARTRVYSGSAIEHAVSKDGQTYSKLDTAFVYRDKIVPNCTCNGRDAFGLVTPAAADDPTLRPGDIVASEQGFMAYAGGTRKNAEFTPVNVASGAGDFRQKFAAAKIVPRNATPVPPQALVDNSKPERRARERRQQAAR